MQTRRSVSPRERVESGEETDEAFKTRATQNTSPTHTNYCVVHYLELLSVARSVGSHEVTSDRLQASRVDDERRDYPSDFYFSFYPPSGMRPPFEPRYGGGYSVGRPFVFELGEPSERFHTASCGRQEGSQWANTVADQEWSGPGSTVEEWRNRFSHGLQGEVQVVSSLFLRFFLGRSGDKASAPCIADPFLCSQKGLGSRLPLAGGTRGSHLWVVAGHARRRNKDKLMSRFALLGLGLENKERSKEDQRH